MTGEDLRFAVLSFSALFLVVDPIAAVPIFVSITGDLPLDKKRSMAKRAAMAIFVTLVVFAVAGRLIFGLFGITLVSFKIAGCLMLFFMSIDMMRARSSPTRTTAVEQAESREREDVAIVPLALPMLDGRGALATA